MKYYNLVSSGAARQRVWPEETSEVLIRSEVVGVAKVANNQNDLVKGSLTRQKLQNQGGVGHRLVIPESAESA